MIHRSDQVTRLLNSGYGSNNSFLVRTQVLVNLDCLETQVSVCLFTDDDDDDLMEVPEEIDEVSFFKSRLGMTGQPCSADKPSTSTDLKKQAPVVDYDLDLEYWENPDELTIPEKLRNDGSRGWVPQTDSNVSFHSVSVWFYTVAHTTLL